MKSLKFRYLAAKNFLCFGPDGIELNLCDYDNIVLIRGYNLDRQRNEGDDIDDNEKKVCSNGSGKSSIPEVLTYALFGRTIKTPKKITHRNVINNQSKKNLHTEVRWGNYRVVRTRKPDGLHIWESEGGDWKEVGNEEWEKQHEISVGGIPTTQKIIEEKLGLNYETFVNLLVFTDNNAGAFLELDGPSKREIVENLLSLDKFREYFDIVKKEKNSIKNTIKLQLEGYQYLATALQEAKNRVIQLKEKENRWAEDKKKELKQIQDLIELKKQELKNSDLGAALADYYASQEKSEELQKQSDELVDKYTKINSILSKGRNEIEKVLTKMQEQQSIIANHKQQIVAIQGEIAKNYKTIESIESLKGKPKCPTCYGQIQEENYASVVEDVKKQIKKYELAQDTEAEVAKELHLQYKTLRDKLKELQEGVKAGEEKSTTISKKLTTIRKEITELSRIAKPEASSHEKIIEQQLLKFQEEENAKKNEIAGPSPFVDLLAIAKEDVKSKDRECDSKKKEIESLEQDIPYYEFFVDALSEDGIRKFVIEKILPALNSRIAYWLQFLIDSKISLKFNNQFDEIIERNPIDGDPFVYHAMSGGERRMLNLAVSQAFAHIMMLNSGTSPSCTFLDEVTSNIDQIGVQGVYNMIMELSREKQIFITTHDHDLLEMLGGCDAIELEKKNGFTRLVN